MTHRHDETALRRMRMAAGAILAREGLRLEPGIGVQAVAGGTVAFWDPAPADNPHGRIRVREEHPDATSADGLARALAAFGREAIRRKAMDTARRKAQGRMMYAPGWTLLAHPLAIAAFAARDRPLDRLPARKSSAEPHPKLVKGYHETTETFDTLSVSVSGGFGGCFATLESKPGSTWLQVEGALPDTMLVASAGQKLARLVEMPAVHRFGTTPLVAAHARAVDAAVAALVVAAADAASGNHTTIELEPCRWLPFGPPPDAETATTLELNHKLR